MKQVFAKFLTIILASAIISGTLIIPVFAGGYDTAPVNIEDVFIDPMNETPGQTELISVESNPSGVQLDWQPYLGAEGYYVYRKVGNESSWTKIAETKKNNYLDVTAKAGKNNTYTIHAYYHSNGTINTIGYDMSGITCRYTDPVRVDVARKMVELGISSLRDAFDYAANLEYKDRENGHTVEWYVRIALKYENADCYTKAAIFCWMARELGYNAKVEDGYVKLSNGDINLHGWVEIIVDGRSYVYDPEFQQEFPDKNGFNIVYGQKDTWVYSDWKDMEEY